MPKRKRPAQTQYNIGEAKAQWYGLIERVENGETIIIARAGKPEVKLEPYRRRRKSTARVPSA